MYKSRFSMCSMFLYRIDIKRKIDCTVSLERFEFFFSCNILQNKPDSMTLFCVGADLSDMLREVERVISSVAYISQVSILNDVVVFDRLINHE